MDGALNTSGLNNSGVGQAASPALRLVSNQELDNNVRKEAEARQQQPMIIGLSKYLEDAWQDARQAKEPIDQMLLKNLRQRKGQYDPDQLALIREQGGSEIFMMLTALKSRAAKALIRDVMIQPDEVPWGLDHTPIPDLPPHIENNVIAQLTQEIMQAAEMAGGEIPPEMIDQQLSSMKEMVRLEMEDQAKFAAERMERLIKDQFAEGGWNDAFEEFLDDFTTFKAAFLEGPIIRKEKKLTWQQIDGQYMPKVESVVTKCYERVSPFDVFPSSDSTGVNDGYLFKRTKYSIKALNKLKGTPGYDSEAIAQVILEYGRGGLRNWLAHDYERAVEEERPYEYLNNSSKIEGLVYYGSAPGFMLREWGMSDEQIPDATEDYEISSIKIGRWVIRAALNPNPMGDRNLHKACWDEIPGAFWGISLPETIRDLQEMCNGAARPLANNMGIASGPIMAYNDISRLPTGEKVSQPHPWMVLQFKADDMATAHRPPIEFWQAKMLSHELIEVMNEFMRKADEISGVPAYSYVGPSASDANKTMGGLSMLLAQASKFIKNVIANIDTRIVKTSVKHTYIHNMLFEDDPTVKGDVNVVARGATAMLVKEQNQIRLNEVLRNSNNEVDLQIMGLAGRSKLWRQVLKTLDIDVDEVVPDTDELLQKGKSASALEGDIKNEIDGVATEQGDENVNVEQANSPVNNDETIQ